MYSLHVYNIVKFSSYFSYKIIAIYICSVSASIFLHLENSSPSVQLPIFAGSFYPYFFNLNSSHVRFLHSFSSFRSTMIPICIPLQSYRVLVAIKIMILSTTLSASNLKPNTTPTSYYASCYLHNIRETKSHCSHATLNY